MRIIYVILLLTILPIGLTHSMDKAATLTTLNTRYNDLKRTVVTPANREAFEQKCTELKKEATIVKDFPTVAEIDKMIKQKRGNGLVSTKLFSSEKDESNFSQS